MLPNSCSFGALVRKLSGADTKRQNNYSHALNEQQHTEYDRYRQRRSDRRAEQQYSDQNIDPTEDERSDTAAFKSADDLKRTHDQPLNTKDDDDHGRDRQGGNEWMPQDKKTGQNADEAAEQRPDPRR